MPIGFSIEGSSLLSRYAYGRNGSMTPSGIRGVQAIVSRREEGLGPAESKTTRSANSQAAERSDKSAHEHPGTSTEAKDSEKAKVKKSNPTELTPEEQDQVRKLQIRDQEVRSHEAAHQAAGGALAGGAAFSTQQGPDGRSYAVGGEVGIDTSPGRTPEETVRKAMQVRAAALAPANPSGQDLSVAAAASKMLVSAQKAMAEQRVEEIRNSGSTEDDSAEDSKATDGNSPQNQEKDSGIRNEERVTTKPENTPRRHSFPISDIRQYRFQ